MDSKIQIHLGNTNPKPEELTPFRDQREQIEEIVMDCHNYPVAHPDYQWHIGGFPFSTNH